MRISKAISLVCSVSVLSLGTCTSRWLGDVELAPVFRRAILTP
jgi:hypothetical protein